MQETARGVFKEKMNILREQFAHAVQEQRWREAIRIGDAIIADFPNTKMAQEVREKMDVLRQRADEPASPVSA
jgi:outer membrane protein assembly factor BamD (BamD/ComL family)